MDNFLHYMLQVNIGLVLFYILYWLVFSRDTFFVLRRWCLFLMVLLSFLCPVLSFSAWWQEEAGWPTLVAEYAEFWAETVPVIPEQPELPFWQQLLVGIWGMGSLAFLGRMCWWLWKICSLARRGKKQYWQGVPLIVLDRCAAPFSFFQWIFVDPALHGEKELREILLHESAHVRQWHSLDLLWGEGLVILFWFNPVVWWLRKEIRQNLEFLADEKVMTAGGDRKNYQYHLLRLSNPSIVLPFVNNFNVKIKKRIVMMNKKKTSRFATMKYLLLLPVAGLLILTGNLQAMADLTFPEISLSSDQHAQLYEGRILDEQHRPLQGVSVVVKGQTQGTLTDRQGQFSIRTDSGNELVFSYVGRKTVSVVCKDQSNLGDIVLAVQAVELDEIVAIGYTAEQKNTGEEEEIFVVVEDMPEFVQGNLSHYLAQRLKYPAKALEQGITGQVLVSFVVDKTGKVTQPTIVRSVEKSLDQEALRLVTEMPDWKPGKQRGVPVDVLYTLPISFRLNK